MSTREISKRIDKAVTEVLDYKSKKPTKDKLWSFINDISKKYRVSEKHIKTIIGY